MAITKTGEFVLQPHQQRVLDRLSEDDLEGVLAYHSMGAGKTATALKAAEKILAKNKDGKALFITPASLQDNIYKERDKHNIDVPDDRMLVRSYEKAVRDGETLTKDKYPFMAIDEAHKLRNTDTKRSQLLRELAKRSDKRLLMTGSAGYNHPEDIVNLTKLLDSKLKAPATKAEFERAFINKNTGGLTSKGKKFFQSINRNVDSYDVAGDPEINQHFPSTTSRIVSTEMSKPQEKVYKYLEGRIPANLRRAVRKNMPLDLKKSKDLNAFASGVRQAATGPAPYRPDADPEESTKLTEAARSMAESAKNQPGFRGVAYSNYLKAGVRPYAELLRRQGIDPLVLTGELSRKQKDELIKKYNELSDEAKVLLLSSSGGEGLDLKGTRKLQILEPHFNQAKIDQVKARAARYKSHAHLPEDQRNVDVEEFQSTFRPRIHQKLLRTKPNTTIDRYLYDLSGRKQKTIQEIKDIL